MKTFKYALRFLSRQKAFSAINIAGLALSLACCIVLSRYLHREFTVDSHAIDPETIVVVSRDGSTRQSIIDLSTLEGTMERGLSDYVRREALETCQVFVDPEHAVKLNGRNYCARAISADSTLLDFFHYQIEGDKAALSRGNGCWISRRFLKEIGLTAQEAIGAAVEATGITFELSGIFDEPESKATVNPDLIFANTKNNWSRMPWEWIRVSSKQKAEEMEREATRYKELPEGERRVIFQDIFQRIRFISWSGFYFSGFPLYVDSTVKDMINMGNPAACWVLAAVLALILIVGVLNFVNLYLVYYQRRAREQGVRKAYGQKPSHLFRELWAELAILVASATFLGWMIVEISSPLINPIMGHSFGWQPFDIWLTLAMLALLPILAMAYPLIKQRRCTPLQSLQERVGSAQSTKSRVSVLALQYVITFSLLIMAIWMRSQIQFLTESPAGFDTEHILITRPVKISEGMVDGQWTSNRDEAGKTVETIISRLGECPAIAKTAISDGTPISKFAEESNYFNDRNESAVLGSFTVGKNWFEVFNIKLKSGSLNDIERTAGDGLSGLFENFEWVANEEAMRLLGYSDITDAHIRSERPLGISWDQATKQMIEYGKEAYPVAGLVESHYSGHRTLGVTPALYWLMGEKYSYPFSNLIIRAVPGRDAEALEYLKKVCEEVCPSEELEYHWFSEDVEKLYSDDRLISKIYTIFSTIAIAICCLGLLGLSMFDIRQRFREVAIRKAHGARRKHLYLLLGKKYLWVLTITFLASIPITYIAIGKYTEQQVESAPLTIWTYLASLLIVSAITAITLIMQLEKACRINAAQAMKTE